MINWLHIQYNWYIFNIIIKSNIIFIEHILPSSQIILRFLIFWSFNNL